MVVGGDDVGVGRERGGRLAIEGFVSTGLAIVGALLSRVSRWRIVRE